MASYEDRRGKKAVSQTGAQGYCLDTIDLQKALVEQTKTSLTEDYLKNREAKRDALTRAWDRTFVAPRRKSPDMLVKYGAVGLGGHAMKLDMMMSGQGRQDCPKYNLPPSRVLSTLGHFSQIFDAACRVFIKTFYDTPPNPKINYTHKVINAVCLVDYSELAGMRFEAKSAMSYMAKIASQKLTQLEEVSMALEALNSDGYLSKDSYDAFKHRLDLNLTAFSAQKAIGKSTFKPDMARIVVENADKISATMTEMFGITQLFEALHYDISNHQLDSTELARQARISVEQQITFLHVSDREPDCADYIQVLRRIDSERNSKRHNVEVLVAYRSMAVQLAKKINSFSADEIKQASKQIGIETSELQIFGIKEASSDESAEPKLAVTEPKPTVAIPKDLVELFALSGFDQATEFSTKGVSNLLVDNAREFLRILSSFDAISVLKGNVALLYQPKDKVHRHTNRLLESLLVIEELSIKDHYSWLNVSRNPDMLSPRNIVQTEKHLKSFKQLFQVVSDRLGSNWTAVLNGIADTGQEISAGSLKSLSAKLKDMSDEQIHPSVERQCIRKYTALSLANNLNELRKSKGLRLELLRKADGRRYSVRVNDQWRFVFKLAKNGTVEDIQLTDYH